MMSKDIHAISQQLVILLKEKEFLKAQETLFDANASSIEPAFHPQRKTEGLSKMLQKEKDFLNAVKSWHEFEVSDPIVSKNHFAIRMYSRLTLQSGEELEMDELIVYTVSNGKINREQFFYKAP